MLYLILSFNLVFALCVAMYWLLLRDGHAFRLNRVLLLLIPVLALVLPHIPRPLDTLAGSVTDRVEEQIPFTAYPFARTYEQGQAAAKKQPEVVVPTVRETPTLLAWLTRITLAQVLLAVYLGGVLVYLLQHLRQWWQLGHTLRRARRLPSRGYRLVRSEGVKEPFSFFRWVVLPQKEIAYTDYQQILEHELVHVRQRHSWDIMLGEWLRILCWFNPLVPLYRSLVRNNLEYLVDDTMLRRGTDQRTYQYSLLSVSLGGRALAMATNYNHSFIKKRIQMMNTSKKPGVPFWKIGVLVLQIFGIVQLFGQGLPPVTKGMHIILIGQTATQDELADLQDELTALEDVEAVFGVDEITYNDQGELTNIVARLDLKNSSGTSSATLSDDQPANTFLPLFMGLRQDGTATFSTLDVETLDQILEHYDDLNLHTAGLDASREALQNIRPAIQEAEQTRKAYITQLKRTEGTPWSASAGFRLQEGKAAQEDVREAVLLMIKSKKEEYPNTPVQYYLDGLEREIDMQTINLSNVEKIDISWEGRTLLRGGEDVKITDVIKVQLIRKRPATGQ